MTMQVDFTATRVTYPESIESGFGYTMIGGDRIAAVKLETAAGHKFGMKQDEFLALFPEAGFSAALQQYSNVAPTLVSSVPADDATDVAVDAAIVMTFSKAIDATTVDDTTITVDVNGGSAVAGTFTVEDEVVTFTPTAPLTNEDVIDVAVTTDVEDTFGLAAVAAAFSFTVVAA